MKGVFVHIPKNAGSSIGKILPDDCNVYRHHPAKHAKSILGAEAYDEHFTFAFVRNPWDRLVSLYHFTKAQVCRRSKKWKDKAALNKNDYILAMLNNDFSGFVKELVKQDTTISIHGHAVGWQQKEWVMEDGEIIVDFIGRFETLEKDMNEVRDVLNINKKLPFLNKTKHKKYTSYYDVEIKNLVSNAYKDDIEMFKYKY